MTNVKNGREQTNGFTDAKTDKRKKDPNKND